MRIKFFLTLVILIGLSNLQLFGIERYSPQDSIHFVVVENPRRNIHYRLEKGNYVELKDPSGIIRGDIDVVTTDFFVVDNKIINPKTVIWINPTKDGQGIRKFSKILNITTITLAGIAGIFGTVAYFNGRLSDPEVMGYISGLGYFLFLYLTIRIIPFTILFFLIRLGFLRRIGDKWKIRIE